MYRGEVRGLRTYSSTMARYYRTNGRITGAGENRILSKEMEKKSRRNNTTSRQKYARTRPAASRSDCIAASEWDVRVRRRAKGTGDV